MLSYLNLNDLLSSQFLPKYQKTESALQWHTYSGGCNVQVPPFWQGLGLQWSVSGKRGNREITLNMVPQTHSSTVFCVCGI